jgi:hypothetical protein
MSENPLDLNDDGEVGAFELSILEEELQSAKKRDGKPPAWWYITALIVLLVAMLGVCFFVTAFVISSLTG